MILALFGMTACTVAPVPQTGPAPAAGAETPRLPAATAVANFHEVTARIEPVAERLCRRETPHQNCDYMIRVERDPRAGVNAFQTVDRHGRPQIIFSLGLIAEARNIDELAFVMGHEAAHHIEEHIPEQLASAREGAIVFGVLAQINGADQAGIRQAVEFGAAIGAQRFSQNHELEADALGTLIAIDAGFDPVRGAAFFDRLPDPGNQFLGSHPPNAARQAVVREAAARFGHPN
ncbi:M48 family metallopeptidase [Rhodophyticola sp. CCM32]|uniref:M48 family metallopeptidase n=1 Tax=Rhodophyticola sp. CCM32 TaxID=2916397 RepID=UPI001EE54EBA|nr:M48 family metallopeptidase [Rhodophyticola sp. CCM32]